VKRNLSKTKNACEKVGLGKALVKERWHVKSRVERGASGVL